MKHTAHASQPHTLPSRSKSQPHDQNLLKSVSVPTHGRQESAANFKDKKTDEKERQCTTSYIKHLAVSEISSVSARIKGTCSLCIFRFIRTPIPALSGHFLGLRFSQK